jgi:PKD repeat protein
MKRNLIFLLLLCFSALLNAQNDENKDNGLVLYPVNFRVTLPLRDLVNLYPVDIEKESGEKESPDRQNRPPQTFLYSPANGPEYADDISVHQTKMGTRSTGKGMLANWAGQSSFARPYDPTGAAGPNHYLQAINASPFQVRNKATGAVLLTANISSLWSPATSDDGDPIVMYDKFADRWFISQFGSSGNSIYIAISTSSDPTGSYYAYTFTSPQFPDYLKFSIWENGYYMTSNQSTDRVFCFERDQMLLGNSSARSISQTFSTGTVSGFFLPMPADAADALTLPDPGTPLPFLSYYENAWGGGTDGIKIWNMTVTWGTTPVATIAAATQINTSAFDGSYNASWNDITQPGTTQKLDGIGGVLSYRAQWTKWSGYNSLVMCWPVVISSTQRSIRWSEIRQDQITGVWSLYQEGTFTPDTDSRWMGSIAMNVNGSIALAYCKSSSTTYPTLAYTGRLAGDPLGVMTFAETVVITGTSTQTGTNRYGDYSQTSLDPDGVTFWHTGEYISNGVKTRIYSFQLPAGDMPPITNFSAYPTNTICSGFVQFSDLSANVPTEWLWEFGDGDTSSLQSPSHTYLASGVYTVTLTTSNAFGTNQLIKPDYITVNIPDEPSVANGVGCINETVVLSANGSGELHWFNSMTGGNDLGTGTTFTTAPLVSDSTFYVENRIVQPSQYVGIATPGGSNSNTAYSLTFDCLSPVTLISAKVNKTTAGSAIFQMKTSTGTILYTDTFNLVAGLNTITFNWEIPVGSAMQLGCTTGGFYRNNSGVSYPYTLSGLITITGCTAGNTRYGPFYNWEIKVPDCISPRVPILASVVTIIEPTVSISAVSTSLCAGSNATLTAAPVYGGITPSYEWFINGLPAGSNSNTLTEVISANSNIYCVLNSALSCANPVSATSNDVNITVTEAVEAGITISVSDNSICEGSNVNFNAIAVNGGSTPGYQWYLNNTAVGSNLASFSGSNFANGDNISCVLTSSELCSTGNPATSNIQNITVFPIPATPVISLNNDTLFSTASSGNQWYFLSTGLPVAGATGQFHIPTMIGDYFVIVTDVNGCVSDTSNLITVLKLGMNNPGNDLDFQLFPNPVADVFYILMPAGYDDASYRLVNAIGQTIMQKEINGKQTKVLTQNLISGVYFVEIISKAGRSSMKKLVIRK